MPHHREPAALRRLRGPTKNAVEVGAGDVAAAVLDMRQHGVPGVAWLEVSRERCELRLLQHLHLG